MNVEAILEVVRQVKRRIAQGDCPTIPAYRVSTLEEVIFDLDAENAALRHDLERCMARELALLNPTASDAGVERG